MGVCEPPRVSYSYTLRCFASLSIKIMMTVIVVVVVEEEVVVVVVVVV